QRRRARRTDTREAEKRLRVCDACKRGDRTCPVLGSEKANSTAGRLKRGSDELLQRTRSKALSEISLLIQQSDFWCPDGGHEEARGTETRQSAYGKRSGGKPEASKPAEGAVREVPSVLPGEDRSGPAGPRPKLQRLRDLVHARRGPAVPRHQGGPAIGLEPDEQMEPGRRGHRRNAGPRARRHRPRGRPSGHGGQGSP